MTDWLTPEDWQALRLSLRVATVATLAALPLALLLAHALARWRFPGRALLNVIVHLPLVLPPVVTGFALLAVFGRQGWGGRLLHDWFGVTLAFRWTGAALAGAVMGLPLMVRAMRLPLEAVDPRLEAAAASLGASRPWVWLTVTLPLILPGVIAGMIMGFAKALGEFGATITFVSNIPGQTQTLPSAIYAALQVPGGEARAARLAGLSVAVSVAALLAAEWLGRRAARRAGGGA